MDQMGCCEAQPHPTLCQQADKLWLAIWIAVEEEQDLAVDPPAAATVQGSKAVA